MKHWLITGVFLCALTLPVAAAGPAPATLRTINDYLTSQPVQSAVADGTVYEFRATVPKVNFWKTPAPLDGLWIESANKKTLLWLSSTSGTDASAAEPCPPSTGNGGGDGSGTGCTPSTDCNPSKIYGDGDQSSPSTDIQPGDITAPEDGDTFCACSTINCTATPGSDLDGYHYECQNPDGEPPSPGMDSDSVTITWDDGGAGGSFSPTTGGNVTYTAPTTLPSDGIITLSATYGNDGTAKYDDTAQTQTVTINLIKVEVETTAPRDTDQIQVQRFANNAGVFTYTAIPLQIYYNLKPDSGWTPDSVELRIKNSAGSTVRTATLPTTVGQQQITWDGKDSNGNYATNGANYTVEITATIDSTTCTASNGFAIYEVRQADCVYRPIPLPLQEHAAVLYEYTGGNKLSDLQDYNKYNVMEIAGPGATPSPSSLGNYNNWVGFYCPPGLSRAQRKAILEKAHELSLTTIPYVPAFPNPRFFNCLIYNDAANSPAGTDWAGTIADIANLRCDGVVEVSYEGAGVRLYGDDSWWQIMKPGAEQWGNLYRHNYDPHPLTPTMQRSGLETQNQKDSTQPFLPALP